MLKYFLFEKVRKMLIFSLYAIVLLRCYVNSQDVVTVETVLGQSAELPCNVTADNVDDKLNILAWYRNNSTTAFYSRDLRGGSGNIMSPSNRYRLLESEDEGLDSLEILAVRLSDAGLYHCTADFAASPARKTFVQLVIIEPTQKLWVIYENGTRVAMANAGSSTSKTIGPYYIGDTIHLFCVAFGGIPQPSLSWWSEQHLLNNKTTPLSDQRIRSDLRFGPLSREHHGRVFTCFSKNHEKTPPLFIDISVDMYLPPELMAVRVGDGEAAWSGRARAGDELALQCRVLGARPLPAVHWRLDDAPLTSPEQNITMEPSQQLMVSEIKLTVSPEYDESKITCCVPAYRRDSNDYECAVGQHLTVLYMPLVHISVGESLENDTLSVVKGSNVSINCSFEANPPVYQLIWFREDDIVTQSSEQSAGPPRARLELARVAERAAGEYVCAASNDLGTAYSAPLALDVVYPPYCEDEAVIEYGVAAEDTINITCKVKANPRPTAYRWLLVSEIEGTKLNTNQSYTLETETDTIVYQRPNCTTTLIYCWGWNSVKNSELPQTKCTFFVTDETIPQPPAKCVAIKSIQKDITVNCEPGHDGGLSQRFKFTVHSLDAQDQIVSIISQEPQFMIHEPKEDNYKFVVVAFNDMGESKVIEINKDDIIDENIEVENTISAVTNITTLALSLCGGVALLALAACALVLCAHERDRAAPREPRNPPLCAYTTDESNCETFNDSEDGSECNIRRTESFRRAMTKYPSKNFDVRRTGSFHSAKYLHDSPEPQTKCVESRRPACRVHSLQNISRKREMDVLCDHLVMHLPPVDTSYNVSQPMNTFYTMPRKTRHKLQKEISDETSEITQASDGFSLPPPPDEFGTYRAATRIKDIPTKTTPTYTTIIRQNSGKKLNKYGNTMSPINTVGLPSISGHEQSLYSYPDDDHQVNTNPFGNEH